MAKPTPLPRPSPLIDRRGPRKSDERRAALLAAVEKLLDERPLAQIGIEDVASAAGVKRSAFYFYFPNKAAAAAALLTDVFDEVLGNAEAFLKASAETSLRESLYDGLRKTAESWQAHEHLLLGMLDARGQDPTVSELWDEWIDRFVEVAAEVIETQRRHGTLPAGPPARGLAAVLMGMNERAYERMSRTKMSRAQRSELAAMLADVWVAALTSTAT
jgi:TetR/AcrR family transcriptional regulator, ethionamide resistance regulator